MSGKEGVALDNLVQQFDNFLVEAHRLKERYAEKITLLVGLETEYITPADLDHLDALLERCSHQIEYIVGSVHHVNEIPIDFDLPTFRKALASFPSDSGDGEQSILSNPEERRMEAFLCAYLDAQYQLLRRFYPEVIGHIDLCRLYNPLLRFADYPRAWEKLKRNITFAVGYGALFELNAAALRKGWSAAYPAEDVVEVSGPLEYNCLISFLNPSGKVIKEAGGKFALSDDSHGPHAVGLNYARMAEYVRHVGISELWVLEGSPVKNEAGRSVQARKIEERWWEHPFWTKPTESCIENISH